MSVDASSRDDAVSKLQAGMTQEGLDTHYAERHQPSEQKPTLAQTHAMIAQYVAAA